MVDRLNKLQQLIDYKHEELQDLDTKYRRLLIKTEEVASTLKDLLAKDDAIRKDLAKMNIVSSGHLKM